MIDERCRATKNGLKAWCLIWRKLAVILINFVLPLRVSDLAIVNTYYFGRLIESKKSKDREVVSKLGVFWPNQDGRGSHINVCDRGDQICQKS